METTDTALAVGAILSIVVCGVCVAATVWRQSRGPGLKPSRSDTDLSMLQDVVTESLPTHK
jgi:hypothetical protein